jgi:SAM-dependent methyltransferase
MSSRAEATSAAALPARLEACYTAYYRDELGIPEWRELVAVRLADEEYEGRRLARLEEALGRSIRGERLLNVGCGTGGFNLVAERGGAQAWGVDAAVDVATIASRRVRHDRIMAAAAEALPFADGSFDVVYCYSTLEHVHDASRAVREMLRVLRPGGALYVHTPNRWAWFETHYKLFWLPGMPLPLARAYLRARGRPTEFLESLSLLTSEECRALIDAAGGVVVRELDAGSNRAVGGSLWPLVRLYYRVLDVRPLIELVALRRGLR